MHNKLDSRCLRAVKLLLAEDNLVPIETIAKEMDVSTKTAKKDLSLIAEFLSGYKGYLHFEKNSGYQISFEGDVSKEAFVSEVLTPLINVERFLPGRSTVQRVILNVLLISEDYISYDHIAEKLFVSRSVINQVSRVVRRYINTYNLELTYKPHYGLRVKGAESLLRLAIYDNHEFFRSNYDFNPLLDELGKDYMLQYQRYKSVIKEHFLQLLNDYKIQIYPFMVLKLTYLITVISVRLAKNYGIENIDGLTFLQDTPFHKISAELFSILNITDENEILWFSMLIFANSDIDTINRMDVYKPYINKAIKVEDFINSYLKNKNCSLGLAADRSELAILSKILIKSKYQISERFLSTEIFYANKNDTFVYYTAVDLVLALRKQFNLIISHDMYFSIAAYLSHKLNRINYMINPINVLFICPHYPTAAQDIKKDMLAIIPEMIKSVKFSFYLSDSNKSDIVFSLNKSLAYASKGEKLKALHQRIVYLNPNVSMQDKLLVYRNVFLKAAGISKMLLETELKAIPCDNAKGKRDIFHMFCLFQRTDVDESMRIMENLTEREDITSFENKCSNAILFVAFNNKDKIHILKRKKAFTWKSRKINFIIFFSVNACDCLEKLKMFKSVADILVFQPDVLSAVYELSHNGKTERAKEVLLSLGEYW